MIKVNRRRHARLFPVRSKAELLSVRLGATGLGDWLTMDQRPIDGMAAATGDRRWIHVDIERAARESPGGQTIAHGYLIRLLTPQLLADLTMDYRAEVEVEGAERPAVAFRQLAIFDFPNS